MFSCATAQAQSRRVIRTLRQRCQLANTRDTARTVAKVLALEPYYGGSHRAFIDGWIEHSRHDFQLLTLPAHHWKWRMRHAAATLLERLFSEPNAIENVDVVWTSSMLNVAELRGLFSARKLCAPTVCYFHENQLEYPSLHPDPRDVHFAFDNWVSAIAADEIWFNSKYNRDTLLAGLAELFRRMPDQRNVFSAETLTRRSHVEPPGIDVIRPAVSAKPDGPLALSWAARWEHDKGPELLLEGLRELEFHGVDFTIAVMGEAFKVIPPSLERLRSELGHRIVRFGHLESKADYLQQLSVSDVFISTAAHEFFGVSVMEAVAAGCRPLLPRKLAYPELFGDRDVFYDGTAAGLCLALRKLATTRHEDWPPLHALASQYFWPRRSASMDDRIDALLRRTH